MRNPNDNLKTYWLRQLEHAEGNFQLLIVKINYARCRYRQYWIFRWWLGCGRVVFRRCQRLCRCLYLRLTWNSQVGSEVPPKRDPKIPNCSFSREWYTFSEPKLIQTVEGGVKHILTSCVEAGTVQTVIITSSTGKVFSLIHTISKLHFMSKNSTKSSNSQNCYAAGQIKS